MKKFLSLLFTIIVFMAFFCFEVSAETVLPKENSWRYKDGQPIKNEYSILMFASPYHPDAKYKGIDVSHHQGQIDWEKVKADGIDFAIIRCGYGEDKTEYDDRWWEYNTSECERLGIPYGVYLYSYAGKMEEGATPAEIQKQSITDAKGEADHVLRLIEGKNLSLPVYYDLEENYMIEGDTQIDLAAVAKTFCDRVEKAGYPVGIYANLNWWTYFLTDSCFDDWYRWVARWNDFCGYEGEYAVWQYSEKGAVDGINVDVDMNFLIGTPKDHKIWSEKLATPKAKLSNDEDSGKPHLSWNKVTGAKEYQIWRKTTKTGRYTLYKTTKDISFTEEGATAGKTYYYRVKAISKSNSVGDSHYSVQKYITCDLAKPVVTAANVASTGKIKLSWKAVDGAVKYEIYRATSKDGEYKLLTTTEKTSVTNTKVNAGQTYYYKVKAIHKAAAANSESNVVSRTCDVAQVTNLKATNVSSSGKIKLTWDAVTGASKYEVYRATSKDGEYTRLTTTTGTSITNTSVTAGKTYYYKVRALHTSSDATGSFSTVVSRTCDVAQVTNLKATNVASSGKIKLTWDAVTGASKYEVYRATSKDGEYTRLTTTTGTSITNTSVTAGKTYYYKVRALHTSSAATGAFSTVVSRMCDLARPEVTVSYSSGGKPKLSWNKVEGAVKYEIYRSKTGKSGSFSKIYTATKTTFTNTSAVAGTTYYYKVVAINSNTDANSAYSAAVNIISR